MTKEFSVLNEAFGLNSGSDSFVMGAEKALRIGIQRRDNMEPDGLQTTRQRFQFKVCAGIFRDKDSNSKVCYDGSFRPKNKSKLVVKSKGACPTVNSKSRVPLDWPFSNQFFTQ
jgi:hypothetical protein